MAKRAGVDVKLIYQYLNKLDHLKIIHYIPQKKTPLIRYTLPREEVRYMKLPDEVYLDRKKDGEKRVQAMIDYCSYTHMCRSRFLLNYFGQKNTVDCGSCDVCIDKKKKGVYGQEAVVLENKILESYNFV